MEEKIQKYKVRSNEEIGQYLFELIDENYESMRQFGIECLKCKGESTNEEDIAKMANRLSQIKKGKKGVQLEDLPVFSHLLNVSAEEILTAGHYFYPYKNRFTNYNFAMSRDKKVWQEYIDREDKMILNTDEYGKTVIDYALEFGNYKFLKYLTDNGYIWFVGNDYKKHEYNFGAGTSIERKPINEINILDTKIKYQDNLRIQMINLAIKNKDFKMLEELHARELPSLYLSGYSSHNVNVDYDRYNENVIENIADADEQVIRYFTEEFDVITVSEKKVTFMYPYINQLIQKLIDNKRSINNKIIFEVLNRCIEHNKNAYNKTKNMFYEKIDVLVNLYNMKFEEAKKNAYDQLQNNDYEKYIDKNSMILKVIFSGVNKFFTTNLITTDCKSANPDEQKLIEELNNWYNKICNNEF